MTVGGGLYTGAISDSSVSEELIVWETGFRTQLTEDVFLDLTAFYNDYDQAHQDTGVNPLKLEHEDTADLWI